MRTPGGADKGAVSRTFYVEDDERDYLRVLWREQHAKGRKQSAFYLPTMTR